MKKPKERGDIQELNSFFMSLVEKLDNDFKTALRARDTEKLALLRLIRGAIKNFEISKQAQSEDEDVVEIVQREIRQHKETIDGYKKAKREDEAEKQKGEIKILEQYLPPQLSSEDLKDVVESAIDRLGATNMADLGKVMGDVMPKVKGKAAGDAVGQMARDILSSKEKI